MFVTLLAHGRRTPVLPCPRRRPRKPYPRFVSRNYQLHPASLRDEIPLNCLVVLMSVGCKKMVLSALRCRQALDLRTPALRCSSAMIPAAAHGCIRPLPEPVEAIIYIYIQKRVLPTCPPATLACSSYVSRLRIAGLQNNSRSEGPFGFLMAAAAKYLLH